MNTAHALAALTRAHAALTGIGCHPFLVDGTLLGAIREGDFIGHDRDVDMGLFVTEHRSGLVATMTRAGLKLRKTFGTLARGLELSFRYVKVKLDLFFYYTDAQGVYHAAWPADGVPIRYRYPAFGLAPLTFRGHRFLAPENPEAFLVAKYGDWKTPVVEWDWRWGPRNAEPWEPAT